MVRAASATYASSPTASPAAAATTPPTAASNARRATIRTGTWKLRRQPTTPNAAPVTRAPPHAGAKWHRPGLRHLPHAAPRSPRRAQKFTDHRIRIVQRERGLPGLMPTNLSRRSLLSSPVAPPRPASFDAASPPLFVEVPAAESGIAWVHENAMSKEHFLPEALGPGVAFLDYDNDGWMDSTSSTAAPPISTVPPNRCAMPSTKTIATEPLPTSPRRPESPAAPSAWASRSVITTTMAGPISSSLPTASASSIATIATAHSPTSPRKPASRRPAGPPAPSGSTTITTAASTSSSAASSITATPRTVSCGDNQAGQALLLHPPLLQAHREFPLSQQRRRHLHPGPRRDGDRPVSRQGPRRRRHRYQ